MPSTFCTFYGFLAPTWQVFVDIVRQLAHSERIMKDRIHTRIDADVKAEVSQIFSRLGLTESDAIRLFYSQVQLHQGLPFAVKIPNDDTIAAMQEDLSNAKRYDSVDALFDELDVK
ncbi:MAG: type II toxin-antitoxin system RelB/DinJ family antitoxin [Chloroflexota bacterium]